MDANQNDHIDMKQLPKVDLHRHLEGTLRLDTMMELSRTYGITLPIKPALTALVQVQETDPYNFSNFLSKFQTLRLFYVSEKVIRRITHEAIMDAAADNVRHLELRFTPVALSRAQSYPLGHVMDWVIESAQVASAAVGITTCLIASVNRHESVSQAEAVAREAIYRKNSGIVGLDLAGSEAEYPALPFRSILREARLSGLRVTVHAGEWGGAENVREAIQDLHADHIGHGVRVLEDPALVDLARELCIPFEVCITSNHQSGVVNDLSMHPFVQMLSSGLNATINTDDPSISDIDLSDEYNLAYNRLGISLHVLKERILAAAWASFLPEEEKHKLVQRLEGELSRF